MNLLLKSWSNYPGPESSGGEKQYGLGVNASGGGSPAKRVIELISVLVQPWFQRGLPRRRRFVILVSLMYIPDT